MSQNYYGGGGGFTVDSPSYGGSQNSPGGGAAKKYSGHSFRPVTSTLVQRAEQAHTDAEWTVDGYEIGAVTMVAQIIECKPSETQCTYQLEDGWGRLEARRWVDNSSEEDSLKWGDLTEHDIVRVSGVIKIFGAKRYLHAQHMRKLKDKHEIYYHMLEVAYTHVALERGHPNNYKANSDGPARTPGYAPSAYIAQARTLSDQDRWSHLPELQRHIVNVLISEANSAEGVHVSKIARSVPGSAQEISDALDKLMDDGHVYTTSDESHFTLSD